MKNMKGMRVRSSEPDPGQTTLVFFMRFMIFMVRALLPT